MIDSFDALFTPFARFFFCFELESGSSFLVAYPLFLLFLPLLCVFFFFHLLVFAFYLWSCETVTIP